MTILKTLKYTFIIIIFFLESAYATDISYQFKIYAKNNNGDNIPQVNKIKSDKKCCLVSIEGSNASDFPDQEGIAKINLSTEKYPPGTKVKIQVDKKWWNIESPDNGFLILPKDSSETISVILIPDNKITHETKKESSFFFSVQVFATKYPEKASEISRSLRARGFESYEIKALKPQFTSLEYEALVVVGKFYNPKDADIKRLEIIRNTDYKNVFVRKIYE